ncbi:MAG: formylglycine-generating enzyme family protein [Victivallaceae bacterium]|nr:formylglycine-generating enzyme family protein [Victivallaceae bacterium]
MTKIISFIATCILSVMLVNTVNASGKTITTKSGIKMVLIPAGEFKMGSNNGKADETPIHSVKVNAFYMDKQLVTQREFERLMKINPSKHRKPKNPVEQVRWAQAVQYCNARSMADGLESCYDLKTWQCDFSKNGYRLPTEAEWEYASRAGSTKKYFWGDSPSRLQLYAYYRLNSGKKPRPVGRKKANKWGLRDIYGNLWEWCNDYYSPDYYKSSPKDNPKGPEKSAFKVLRGGSWKSKAKDCRSASRAKETPAFADICFGYDTYGFRCVRNVTKKQ